MAGVQINGVVLFVRDLQRSVSFYRELLGLEVIDASTTAALLTNGDGTHLILRAAGPNAPHPLGAVGVQYVVWMVPSKQDLDRCERFLRQRSAYRETPTEDKGIGIEGRDPDDVVVMLTYPGAGGTRMRELPTRIYAW